MKNIFINSLIFLSMTTVNGQIPSDILGKHISEISVTYSNSGGDMYTIIMSNEYLGKQYNNIYVSTDKKEIVQNFSIYIDEIIDRQFYDLMIKEYGEPEVIYKAGEIISQEKTKTYDDGLKMQSTTSTLKECTFEESPLFIIWNKEEYDIEVGLGNENDTFKKTRITFGKGPLTNFQN